MQLNIPIVHIEGLHAAPTTGAYARAEKYTAPPSTTRQADVIYTYFPEYKEQGVREGLNPNNIMLVGNPIVDILNHYYFSQKARYDAMATPEYFSSRGIQKDQFYLMTCHRRENVHITTSLQAILDLTAQAPYPVYFPASYRTQKEFQSTGLKLPGNVRMVDPIGYEEMLCLMVNSRGVITDSGTVVEETCVLQVPSLQMRKSTERPQVYDVGSSVKFDPAEADKYPAATICTAQTRNRSHGKKWPLTS